jgi:hypothetical protein
MRHDIPPEFREDLGLTDITDVPRELPAAPEYPVAAMPRACQALIAEASAATGCPPEFVGVPMLAVLGAAIGNSRVLFLPQRLSRVSVYADHQGAAGHERPHQQPQQHTTHLSP